MMADNKKNLTTKKESDLLLQTLKTHFEKNKQRHNGLDWKLVQDKLEANPEKLWSLSQMEKTEGEPDVVLYDPKSGDITFFDCSPESPKGRRSLCYDQDALDSRKEFKPENSAIEMAKNMGIELLNESQFRHLQTLGKFDTKTSSWIKTPEKIRKLGGALFADFRYDTVFVYHNGASSYYAARGFRGSLIV
jgi:hypothetical protein